MRYNISLEGMNSNHALFNVVPLITTNLELNALKLTSAYMLLILGQSVPYRIQFGIPCIEHKYVCLMTIISRVSYKTSNVNNKNVRN